MPPNRKALEVLVPSITDQDVAALKGSVTAKVNAAPTTTGKTASQQEQQDENIQSSYWDWPADDAVETKESVFCVLSTENIVSNLLQAAAEYRHKQEEQDVEESEGKALKAEHDSYWAEAEQESTICKPQHKTDHLLKEILQRHEAIQRVSAATIQANEVRHRQAEKDVDEHQIASDAYWILESEPVQKDHLDYWNWETTDDASGTMTDQMAEYEQGRQKAMLRRSYQQIQQHRTI